jgi:lipopolysaccharide transport system ATP-binding protein
MAPSVIFDQVSKSYRMGGGLPGLRDIFGQRTDVDPQKLHWAVKGLSFELQQGEALGFIGPNGAGKTTTLKLLSHVTQPTSGSITVRGRFSALIELGAGFHPDLTGRENVFLNGTILGMRKQEIKARFDQIVDFAGIEQFIDTPVKRYSSGMYARLGFAIAAHVDPDVMLVDEVLAVGDYAFRMKCYDRMDQLRAKGTSLIFVSHNMEDIRRVCDKAIVMYQGQKAFEGPAGQGVAEYANILRKNASRSSKPSEAGAGGLSQRRMTHAARIERVEIIDEDGHPTTALQSGQTAYIRTTFQCFEDAPHPVCACTMYGANGEVVYDTTTQLLGVETPVYRAGEWATITYKLDLHLLDGTYNVAIDLAYADLSCYYDYIANAINFTVTGARRARGVANLCASVSFEQAPAALELAPVQVTEPIVNGNAVLQLQ